MALCHGLLPDGQKSFKICLAVSRHNTACDRQTDRQTDTARRQRERYAERPAGNYTTLTFCMSGSLWASSYSMRLANKYAVGMILQTVFFRLYQILVGTVHCT